MEKLKPRAVIFDLGSTLIEYEAMNWDELGRECAESGREFLLRKGYDIPAGEAFHEAFADIREGYRRTAAESLIEWDVLTVAEKLFARLGLNSDDGLVDSFFDAYYKPVESRLYVYDDTVSTLREIKDTGVITGLISNTVFPERAHLGELKRFGIEPLLDFTVFSSSFGLRKPHPDIFYHAVNLAGCAPSEAVYVGDRYVEDVQGPEAIGMHAVLKMIPGREYPPEIPETVRRIESLGNLREHLDL